MGIPYSREINAAFEQVTPLVAAGFKVLRTTKNISILLAIIQVLTVLFLGVIAVILLAILYSINPDVERERQELITPALQWLAAVSWRGVGKVMLWATAALGACVVIAWLVWEEERVEGEDADGDIVAGETEKAKKKNAKGNKKKGKQEVIAVEPVVDENASAGADVVKYPIEVVKNRAALYTFGYRDET